MYAHRVLKSPADDAPNLNSTCRRWLELPACIDLARCTDSYKNRHFMRNYVFWKEGPMLKHTPHAYLVFL